MNLSVAELQLLLEALSMAASRHRSYATAGALRSPRAVRRHELAQQRMMQLRNRLSGLRARRDILEVAP